MRSLRPVRLSHVKLYWRFRPWDRGVRLSHSRQRIPVMGGEDTWVPNYRWNLPRDGFTPTEAREEMQRLNDEAKRRYQAKKQQHAETRRRGLLRTQRHEEPPLPGTLKTEPHPDGGTMNWIS